MSHPAPAPHHYHAPHAHHPLHPPKKSAPGETPPSTLQAKVKVLAKINFWITAIPFFIMSLVLLLLYFRMDMLHEHSRTHNNTFYADHLKTFLALEKNEQWKTFLVQYGWETAELILAYVLVLGAKHRDYGYMKAWLCLMCCSFLAELGIQGSLISGISFREITPALITVMAVFGITDLYRFSCLFIVYLLIDEMLERCEVPRDRARPNANEEDEYD